MDLADQCPLKDLSLVDFCKATNWQKVMPPVERSFDFPGLVGARTAYSTGSGTVNEWAKAAKSHGFRYIVFLEDFKHLKPENFVRLTQECADVTNDSFAAFPGITIDDEIGNHYFYFGSSFPLPSGKFIDESKRVFRSYDPALGGDVPGQIAKSTQNYFIHQCIAKMTGGNYLFSQDAAPFSDWFCNWNAMGVVTSFDGKLKEFAFNDYLSIVASGQGPFPMALTFVDSPDKIGLIKWKSIFKSRENSTKELLHFFNHQKCYPDNPCTTYITNGPQIKNWSYSGPRDYEGNNRGNFVWQNQRWKLHGNVGSDVNLKEVVVWNGTKVFRRFRPENTKSFSFTMDLTHDKQHYLLLEVIDVNGKKAISREHWDRNHRLEEFICGDRNNQLTYSMSVDSKGRKVGAGNNRTLGTPYKRVGEANYQAAPHGVFRSANGFDGGVFRGPRFRSQPEFVLKNGKKLHISRVVEAFRRFNSMDTHIGDGHRQYRFEDNIRVANVWHTMWKVKRNEYFDVFTRNRYFQLDPDQPIGVFIKTMRFKLLKDMPNDGLSLNDFLEPLDAKYFAVRTADNQFYCGGWSKSKTTVKKPIEIDFVPNSYIAAFGSVVGGDAAFPLCENLKGTIHPEREKGFFNLRLPADKSPQKTGEEYTLEMLFVGIPNRPPHQNDNNIFFENFYRQFGLDGGKGGYTLDLKNGTVKSNRYILKIDGGTNRCAAGTISGKLVARLPITVMEMNDNWSAYYFDGKIGQARPVGVFENQAWSTIIAKGQEFFVGHPVIANNENLFIQVTQSDKNAWSVEIHNPTDHDITTNITLNKFFPPFKNLNDIGELTVKAGQSAHRVVK